MHNNIIDSHVIIIQYPLSTVLISLVIAFAPLIIAKFANNVCIFSTWNISFITINITITKMIAITNIKNIECQMVKNRSFYEVVILLVSLSKVSCCLSKLTFSLLIPYQPILLVFLVLIIILHQSHLTLMILAKYVPVL